MPKPGTKEYAAEKVYKALFKRKTRQGQLNVLIDAVAEQNFWLDESLHFFNEVVVHKHPKQHWYNTMKYGVKPRLRKKIGKMI